MTAPALPEWATKILPVDMDGAAMVLGISRRFLIDVIKDHPQFERRGSKKVFYPEHITQLREVISCPDSKSKTKMASGGRTVALRESAYDRALALATKKSPSKKEQSSKPTSGKVIPMERKP